MAVRSSSRQYLCEHEAGRAEVETEAAEVETEAAEVETEAIEVEAEAAEVESETEAAEVETEAAEVEAEAAVHGPVYTALCTVAPCVLRKQLLPWERPTCASKNARVMTHVGHTTWGAAPPTTSSDRRMAF